MLKMVLALILGGMAACGQAPNQTANEPKKVDRATAYYHFVLAYMYSEMADASFGNSREYENKVVENYKAAVKADPQTPNPRALLSPFAPVYIPPPPPASRQDRSRP